MVILDEPASGLDVGTMLALRALVNGLARDGRIVFYSSHEMETVERHQHARHDPPRGTASSPTTRRRICARSPSRRRSKTSSPTSRSRKTSVVWATISRGDAALT
jgi:ABC-type glutathione transport system ATPase component